MQLSASPNSLPQVECWTWASGKNHGSIALATRRFHGLHLFGVTARGSGESLDRAALLPVHPRLGSGSESVDPQQQGIRGRGGVRGFIQPYLLSDIAGQEQCSVLPLTVTEGNAERLHNPHPKMS